MVELAIHIPPETSDSEVWSHYKVAELEKEVDLAL